jgi:hypothetical protein
VEFPVYPKSAKTGLVDRIILCTRIGVAEELVQGGRTRILSKLLQN